MVEFVKRQLSTWEHKADQSSLAALRICPMLFLVCLLLPFQAKANDAGKLVLGYLPYWELGYSFHSIDDIDVVAYFSIEMNEDGEIEDDHGWFGEVGTDLVDFVHGENKSIIITATNFSSQDHESILLDDLHFEKAVQSTVDAVLAMDADGVNIDFEGLPYACKTQFTLYVGEVNAQLKSIDPGYHVSVATPKVDWQGSYDYDELAANSDYLMIMSYGYHWKGGNPGPMCPIFESDIWGEYCLDWSVNDHLYWGGAHIAKQLLVGLGFYGRDWQTTDENLPGIKLDGTSGEAVSYVEFLELEAALGSQWDSAASAPYITYTENGQAHQVFAENRESIGLKIDYVEEQALAGVGIWALGYDGETKDYWAEISRLHDHEPDVIVDPEDTVEQSGLDSWSGQEDSVAADSATDPDADSSNQNDLNSAESPCACTCGCQISDKGDGSVALLFVLLLIIPVCIRGRRRISSLRQTLP